MKAQKLKEQAKFKGWHEDSIEEVTEYIFTEEEMAIFWNQLCKEQREICAIKAEIEYTFGGEEYIDTTKIEYAPEPEFE